MYELCIPYTVSNEEKLKRCLAFNGVNQYRPTGTCEYDDLEGDKPKTEVFRFNSVIHEVKF